MPRREVAGGVAAGGEFPPRYRLYDMHCHLDRIENGVEVARELSQQGIAVFCNTVTPADYDVARERFRGRENVRVGAGLHPWWVPEDEDDGRRLAELAAERAAGSRYIGEIGLDFGRAHAGTRDNQVHVLEEMLRACAEHPMPAPRVLSIHAVRSADTVLDLLERYGLVRSTACIFHWFSGASGELARARRLGCLFSINEMMLATKKGREYARVIPEDRLLLETDAPPHLDAPYDAMAIEDSLERSLELMAGIRGVDPEALGESIARNSARLLG